MVSEVCRQSFTAGRPLHVEYVVGIQVTSAVSTPLLTIPRSKPRTEWRKATSMGMTVDRSHKLGFLQT